MATVAASDRVLAGKTSVQILPKLDNLALAHRDLDNFFAAALKLIQQTLGADMIAIVEGVKGQWRLKSVSGPEAKLPTELLAEILDEDRCLKNSNWIAAPLTKPCLDGELLVAKFSRNSLSEIEFDGFAAALGLTTSSLDRQVFLARRADRLASLLEMTASWNLSRETDQLLENIAVAATRLLGAERATIFLPDPSGTMLIGRPALGVEEGELRVPIQTGVVGNVIQTGKPARVDADISDEQKQISREVDKKLGFQTRTLLCVPLINRAGKTIGAFELINRLSGNFTVENELELAELAAHATVAIDNTQHVEHLVSSRRTVAEQAAGKVELIGNSPEIEKLKTTIRRVANTDLVVLITGENGTGKEVVAQMIHYLSARRDEVIVAVNCAAISESLLESELFGHEKGAFTDAHQTRVGKFELANGGTLFLDEIGDMSLSGQSKLLRVLEERTVVRVGGSIPIPTTARMIAATNQDLAALVTQKKFRQDLFFRLNVVPIQLPPLRDRGEDVLLLADYFLHNFCLKARRETPTFTAAARKQLLSHHWPGNIRELRNLMERLAYLTEGNKVDASDLAFVIAPVSNEPTIPLGLPLAEATRQFQIDYIQRHIKRARGNMSDAAERMGLHRSNLYRKMKQLGMSEGIETEDGLDLDDNED
jgi:transcriptional regulator with GAF, ATPase, and Fis domain